MIRVPDGFAAYAGRGPQWADFVDSVPRLAAELVDRWELRIDGEPRHGYCAVVVPVRTTDGEAAVLKMHVPDEASEHEHVALRLWDGRGAVRLLRADPTRSALLLERLSFRSLRSLPVLEACEVIAQGYGRLHVPAPGRLRTLTSSVERWTAELDELPRDVPVPRRLVEQAASVGRDLVADAAAEGVVVHGDLHDENVLAAQREPWLVIDPQPTSGDPHYEPAPVLWNRWDEALTAHDLRAHLRARFFTLVDVAGLDEDRAKAWVLVRMVHQAVWAIQDVARVRRGRAPLGSRGLSDDDRSWITRCITVVKAVQD